MGGGVRTHSGDYERVISPSTRMRSAARWANRARWRRKFLVARSGDGNASNLQRWLFILVSAETDTFSYELANGAHLAASLAEFLGVDRETILAFIAELRSDQRFSSLIKRRTRWRPQYRWSPPLGRHVIAYCIVRASHPPTVLELGVRHGLGSLVLLRALELNRSDGYPGELVSIDCDTTAGALVPPGAPWRQFTGMTPDVLSEIHPEAPIGFVISDTTPDPDVIRGEFGYALEHAHRPIVFMQNHGWSPVLGELVEQHNGTLALIEERALNHVVKGRFVDLLRIGELDDAL